jgi:hypothetical protein
MLYSILCEKLRFESGQFFLQEKDTKILTISRDTVPLTKMCLEIFARNQIVMNACTKEEFCRKFYFKNVLECYKKIAYLYFGFLSYNAFTVNNNKKNTNR